LRWWKALADRLAHFEGFAKRESVAALDYLYWRRAIAENAEANRGLVSLALQDSVPPSQYDALLLGAISRAATLLRDDRLSPDASFGDVFRVGRGSVSLPLGGFVGTMRAMVYGPPDGGGLRFVYSGQRQPMVVVMSNPIQSFTSLNFGESNDPSSTHYADQSILMSEKRLKPTWFVAAELSGHIEKVITLSTQLGR
jgi:penicillin amidase